MTTKAHSTKISLTTVRRFLRVTGVIFLLGIPVTLITEGVSLADSPAKQLTIQP